MITLLKLGGSLITDKQKARTPRLDVIKRIANEIAECCRDDSTLQLLIGHGSGSFAHRPAKQYSTKEGVNTPDEWRGFVEVWKEASALNRLVIDAFHNAGLPVISFPPSASIITNKRKIISWDVSPLKMCCYAGLIPVVYGDVIFDQTLGGTIFSTEDLFAHLVEAIQVDRVLFAGIEPGVWRDFPSCTQVVQTLTPENIRDVRSHISGSNATDVTGGMASKVDRAITMVIDHPNLKISVFSGGIPGNIYRVLHGDEIGTQIIV